VRRNVQVGCCGGVFLAFPPAHPDGSRAVCAKSVDFDVFQDMVPKAIMCFLVLKIRENLQNELISKVYRPGEAERLMEESAELAERRKVRRAAGT